MSIFVGYWILIHYAPTNSIKFRMEASTHVWSITDHLIFLGTEVVNMLPCLSGKSEQALNAIQVEFLRGEGKF
jgi:hypothetical protein